MVAFGYFFITKDKWVKVVTKSSDTKSITLPDSSVITLGKNTELSYNASDWSSDRSIHLDGEAFFEVKRNGNSFIVESSNARVTVLGTSFKVTSKRQHTAVTCFTGKVSVTNKDAEHEVILTRGLQTIVNNDEVAQPYAAADDTLIEDLNFKNTPLSIVFQSIARYHGTRIIINADVNEVSFTGNLKEISLESALRTVCLSAGLEYELSKDSITVKRP
jgi:ferric-dicitrate binding protein FerR (iron transport regulator)